ncbi:PilN domain-containing protein [Acanthopleuribacter pedis]|uniref:PilN domain-containing protein n=1 Tax=Acanthopleuribacter pedis TaxID=442870 RepID=A0A8J7QL68_9BACT|nr:PilN domain-containing protein [Acanthopleuribacter pedis]MBO1320005.1 PilN domain-containing protein [Acanthopleuribacter pedis]
MIRINLIAERKAGAPKAQKKATRQASDLEENLILIIMVLVALGACYANYYVYKQEQQELLAEKRALQAEYDKLKVWIDKREQFEIQKELLNEKIQKISQLKDRRQGPVKLMEDIHNVLPESVWLTDVTQGLDKNLLNVTKSGRQRAKGGSQRGITDIREVRISGFAKNTDAITTFARSVQGMEDRYSELDLNQYSMASDKIDEGSGFQFLLYFKIQPANAGKAKQEGGTP